MRLCGAAGVKLLITAAPKNPKPAHPRSEPNLAKGTKVEAKGSHISTVELPEIKGDHRCFSLLPVGKLEATGEKNPSLPLQVRLHTVSGSLQCHKGRLNLSHTPSRAPNEVRHNSSRRL